MEKVKIIKTYGMTTEIKVDSDGDLHISQGSDIIVIAQSNIPPPPFLPQ